MRKPKTRDPALPRRRNAGALSLQDPRHRQRIIPDKRRAAIAREQASSAQAAWEAPDRPRSRTRVDELAASAPPGCNFDHTGEYDCTHRPCIRCLGPWNRNR